jgi:hypothetical protein
MSSNSEHTNLDHRRYQILYGEEIYFVDAEIKVLGLHSGGIRFES